MKKVTIYFKSGNKVSFKCKKFEIECEKNSPNRTLTMVDANINNWMFDLSEIEAYIVDFERRTFWSPWF